MPERSDWLDFYFRDQTPRAAPDMIWPVADIIGQVSQAVVIKPADLI